MEREPTTVTHPKAGEPESGRAPAPSWFWVLMVVAVAWAAFYVAFNSGGFQAGVFNPQQVSWVGGSGVAVAPPDPREIGRRVFTKNCVVCHQSSGEGVAGQFPSLVGSPWVLSSEWHGENHLVRILINGLQGPVEVKGVNYNGAMPTWKQLGADQIAAVLTYIRSEWGNAAPPISAEYVASLMEQVGNRTEPWSQKELQAIPKESPK